MPANYCFAIVEREEGNAENGEDGFDLGGLVDVGIWWWLPVCLSDGPI
jgi:hypothetical protein